MATHPWGLGIGGFRIAEGLSHGGTGKWSAPHNSFIKVAAELGVAGLVVFILLIGRTIKELRQVQTVGRGSHPEAVEPRLLDRPPPKWSGGKLCTARSVQGLASLSSALEISLWGFIVGGFFLTQAYSMFLYTLLALSLACIRLAEPVGNTAQAVPGFPSFVRRGEGR